MASSSIVIKVMFGDTLRRFRALIHDGRVQFDMIRLREKIHSLFNFSRDIDFSLTYIDEDGDIVTLADEDDLRDVVRQSLDPLRITVKLNSDSLDRSGVRSSGSSKPLTLSQDPLALNSGVSEVLNSVPEPLSNALMQLFDMASKATSSMPVVAELVETLRMISLSQVSKSQAGPRPSTPNVTLENKMDTTDITIDQQVSNIGGASVRLAGSSLESSTLKEPNLSLHSEVGSSNSRNKTAQLPVVNEGMKLEESLAPWPVDLNGPYPNFENVQYPKKDVKKFCSRNCGYNASFHGQTTQVAFDIPTIEKSKDVIVGVDKNKENDIGNESPYRVQPKPVGFGASNPKYVMQCLQDSKMTEMSGSNDSGTDEHPFTGTPLSSDSTVQACSFAPHVPPFKRSYNHSNGMSSIFHRGVCCDGCGVLPITGPRFKSKVKHDYDLCGVCFDGMGHDADFIRFDFPVTSCPPLPPMRLYKSVDASLKGLSETLLGLNLHPPVCYAAKDPETVHVEMNHEPFGGSPDQLAYPGMDSAGAVRSSGSSEEPTPGY